MCDQVWHSNCVGLEGITEVAITKLNKWKCHLCFDVPEKMKAKSKNNEITLKSILDKMGEMQELINRLEAKVDNNNENKNSSELNYSAALKLGKVDKNVQQLMKNQSSKPETTHKNNTERFERTLIVKSYSDKNIRNSKDVRRVVSNAYKNAAITGAFTTVKGSILLEFADKQTADTVKESWNPDLFGGNKGVVNLKPAKPAGLIKYVYQNNISEDELIEAAQSSYPNTDIELFKNKDKKFTGTIKVSFNSSEDLEAALNNTVSINNHRYIMEKYEQRPQIVRCFNCQKFAHIARVCLHEGSICGKCSSKEHSTKECMVAPKDYKCFHCGGNHETGNRKCEVIRLKTEELRY